MSFDPTRPVENTEIDAVELRNQFNGLKDLIDAIPAGSIGPPGPAGANGNDGASGAPGPQGVPGNPGDAGPAGNNGADGVSISNVYDDGSGRCVIQLSNGNTYGPFTIASGPSGMQGPQGEQGATGAQGNTGCDGSQGPQGPQGNNGNDGRYVSNVYDDGSGRAVIQMSDGGTYGPFTVASGPQGMPGNQGPQGNNGNDGSQGPQGSNGTDGAQGPQGSNGNDGVSVTNVYDDGSGRCIIQLSNGATYGPFTVANGPQGPQGNPGNDGAQGPQGEQGPPGVPAESLLTLEVHAMDAHDPGDGGSLLLRGGDVDGAPGARLELTGFLSSGKPGGGEIHLTITALKINGLTGINDTLNIGGTSLTFTHGILTSYG